MLKDVLFEKSNILAPDLTNSPQYFPTLRPLKRKINAKWILKYGRKMGWWVTHCKRKAAVSLKALWQNDFVKLHVEWKLTRRRSYIEIDFHKDGLYGPREWDALTVITYKWWMWMDAKHWEGRGQTMARTKLQLL